MIGCFVGLAEQDLKAVQEKPERFHALLGLPQIPASKLSFLQRLFGAKTAAIPAQPDWKPSKSFEDFDVDKAWHGIHFLLTGSDWEGEGPLAFILHGGEELKGVDNGYGPPHVFTSAEVREINRALEGIDPQKLFEKADQADFTKNEIYPEIWDSESKEDCIGYVTENLAELKRFIAKIACEKKALIVYLG
ncbi:MAG TPA: YfbM family protein [Candidatus Dormibacteraeota bacterium]|nr:YfbM family protein [Candidatus Dormibacteraeota bacterium]